MKRARTLVLLLAAALLAPALGLALVAEDGPSRHADRPRPAAIGSVESPGLRAVEAVEPASARASEVGRVETATSLAGVTSSGAAQAPTEVRRRTASELLAGWPEAPVWLGDPRVDPSRRRWRDLVDRALVDVDYQGGSLLEALEDLCRRTGLPFVVPAESRDFLAEHTVTLRLRQIPLKDALDLLIGSALGGGYGWCLEPEGLRVTLCDGGRGPGPEVDPDLLLAVPEEPEATQGPGVEDRVTTDHSTDWRSATLGQAFERLGRRAGLVVFVDPEVDAERPVPPDADLRGVSVRQAFEALCRSFDLAVTFDPVYVEVRPGPRARADAAERARQDEVTRAFLHGVLEGPGGLTGGTPVELARQLEVRGVPVVLDDAAAASTTYVPAATADPLLLVCERVAFAAGCSWTLALGQEPGARPGLVWRGSSDALDAFLAHVQAFLHGAEAPAAVAGAERLALRARARRELLQGLSPAALRSARLAEAHVFLGLLMRDLTGAVAAADGARHVDGVRADAARVERFGALAGWLSVYGGACEHPEEGPGVEPPRETSCAACARRWAESLAAWLATDPAPVGHPSGRRP